MRGRPRSRLCQARQCGARAGALCCRRCCQTMKSVSCVTQTNNSLGRLLRRDRAVPGRNPHNKPRCMASLGRNLALRREKTELGPGDAPLDARPPAWTVSRKARQVRERGQGRRICACRVEGFCFIKNFPEITLFSWKKQKKDVTHRVTRRMRGPDCQTLLVCDAMRATR
jgi:hypothetical protein